MSAESPVPDTEHPADIRSALFIGIAQIGKQRTVHQCCKLNREEWDSYLDWLFAFEYQKLGLPVPDKVFYLRVQLEESQLLMTDRYHGDEHRKDIHESNTAYLEKAEKAAEYCAKKYSWEIVNCMREGALLSIETIGDELLKRFDANNKTYYTH